MNRPRVFGLKKHPSVTRQRRKAASHLNDAGRNSTEIFLWGLFSKYFQNSFSSAVVAQGPTGDSVALKLVWNAPLLSINSGKAAWIKPADVSVDTVVISK